MDSKAQRKALFRSRLRETSQKREKRIDSPLVRYNEDDQLVCRVCSVTLKSDSLWPAHQASKKHHEAIENIKAAAAAAKQSLPGNSHVERQQSLPESRVASTLPADFFDGQEAKKKKTEDVENRRGSGTIHSSVSKEVEQTKVNGSTAQSSKQKSSIDGMQVKSVFPKGFSDERTDEVQNFKSQVSRDNKNLEIKEQREFLPSSFFDKIDSKDYDQAKQPNQRPEIPDVVEHKQVTGALPEGFFDNKDKDLKARGIEPIKVDIEDAYKEFERDIQEDLQEVDDRLEEEEIDAAEVREEIEFLEHKAYRERVEMVKKQLKEAKELRLARLHKSPDLKDKDSSEDSSSDDGVDEDFSVDWRAKRF